MFVGGAYRNNNLIDQTHNYLEKYHKDFIVIGTSFDPSFKNKTKLKQEDLMKPFIILGEITFIKDNFFGTQPILEKDFILSFNLSDNISKNDIYLEYQGCFKNSFCYSKKEEKIPY